MTQTFKHAVIACHPEKKSFTLSVAERYAATVRAHGHEVVIRDLYRNRFKPVLRASERRGTPAPDVVHEWGQLGKIDVYVLVYPIWFGTPPAMLKGYIDRVFGAGRSRGQGGEGGPRERLEGKRLVSLTSSGSMRAWLNEKGVLMSLHNVCDRYFRASTVYAMPRILTAARRMKTSGRRNRRKTPPQPQSCPSFTSSTASAAGHTPAPSDPYHRASTPFQSRSDDTSMNSPFTASARG